MLGGPQGAQVRDSVATAQVTRHLRQRLRVYSIDGCTYAVKAWGEPPAGSGGVLIYDDRLHPARMRALTDAECWRLQGRADDEYRQVCAAPGPQGFAAAPVFNAEEALASSGAGLGPGGSSSSGAGMFDEVRAKHCSGTALVLVLL